MRHSSLLQGFDTRKEESNARGILSEHFFGSEINFFEATAYKLEVEQKLTMQSAISLLKDMKSSLFSGNLDEHKLDKSIDRILEFLIDKQFPKTASIGIGTEEAANRESN